jgi:hypothetical protein
MTNLRVLCYKIEKGSSSHQPFQSKPGVNLAYKKRVTIFEVVTL